MINPNDSELLFKGGGEMGRRTREFDWASTSVGPIHSWPASLRSAVNIVLSSRFPMFIWWGDDLIQFYNDAYRPSMGNTGKHPLALGQRGEECWPEIWPVIYPLIRQVLDGGDSTWSEDQLIPIYRNGRLEDVYWTFSYSPIIRQDGQVGGVLVVCSENTEKVLSYQLLKESEDQLSFAVEAAELGTWDYDPATGKFNGNRRLKSWFGLQADEDIELTLAIAAIAPKDQERVTQAIQRALDHTSGGYYDIKYTIVDRSSGQERIVHAKGRAWFNEYKIAYRFNGTLQDITLQKKIEETLTQLVAERTRELERSNNDLLQFAHVISHDLKEPVRKILIYTRRMLDEMSKHLPSEGQKYLNKVVASSGRMAAMIEGVLQYSTITSSTEAMTAVHLNDVVRQICDDLEITIQQKEATIHFSHLPTVDGTPVLIYQLFYNLVNNSLKFSRAGVAPVIDISAVPQREYPGFVQIAVRDNGIGFEKSYAEDIFESFTRLHSKDVFEGTGLGLALVKKIVERHHGIIYATADPGEGATFILTLPIHEK